MGVKGAIDDSLASIIAGSFLYLVGSVVDNIISDENDTNNLKTLEKKLGGSK